MEVPAFVAFYRATQNYIGADDFELEITFAARLDEKQKFHRQQRLRQLRIHSAIGSHATYIICVTENCQPEGAENREGRH
jgi:hypothetical protein